MNKMLRKFSGQSRIFFILLITLTLPACVSPSSISTPLLTRTPVSTSEPTVTVTSTQTMETRLATRIDEYMSGLEAQDQFSGAMLIAKDGKVTFSKGYGMANLEFEVRNTPQTRFRIGSITKQFTAVAILQLQQQGKLNVKDALCLYIRTCPAAWQAITIHHLLTHTSGIPDYIDRADFLDNAKHPVSPIQIIDRFQNLPLDFPPGEGWRYSSSGYVLLGYIVEKLTGQSYELFLQKNIFEPLQMANTGVDQNRTIIKDHASGYATKHFNAEYVDMSWFFATGSLYSTVEDLFLWDQALYGNTLVDPLLRDAMFESYAPVPGADTSYGYGWYIGKLMNRKAFGHTGTVPGFASVFIRYPDEKVTIIFLGNRDDIDREEISTSIAMIFFDQN